MPYTYAKQKEVTELSKKYAPLVKGFIDNNYPYIGIEGTIKYSFFWNDDPSITATTSRSNNVISINLAFVEEEVNNNRPFVIEYFVIHEMRHVYQHIEIEKYKTHSNECSSEYIERWIQEGNSYIQSLDENGNENIDYFKQDCELDAYAFSYALMHYKYKGKYDALLYLPDIYHNQMKDEFERAIEVFLGYFKG